MKRSVSQEDLDSTLRRATGLPIVLAVSLLIVGVVWNTLEERRKTLAAYRTTLSQMLEFQKKFIAQEVLLGQQDALLARFEAITHSPLTHGGDVRICMMLTPTEPPAHRHRVCTDSSDLEAFANTAATSELPIDVGNHKIASLSYWMLGTSPWVGFLPKLIILVGMALLGAFLLHRRTVRNLQTDVLRPLLKKLARTERNAALSEAAQMLAHDIRKPFALLRLVLFSLKAAKTEEDIARIHQSSVPKIEHGLEMVEGLMSDILEMESARPFESESLPLTQELVRILEETKTLHPKVSARIRLDCRHRYKPSCEPRRIKRVLGNIIENAYQAVEPDGVITVKTVTTHRHDKLWVELSVSNTGSYVADDDLRRIFRPFFSTKKNGTGLGLSIAKKFIDEHGGWIECNSSEKIGTEFRFSVPSSRELEIHTSCTDPPAVQCKTRILVFDDDEIVHKTWRQHAREQGIESHHYSSWEDFLTRGELDPSIVSVAFVDVNYRSSRWDGIDIARNLRQLGARSIYAITLDSKRATESRAFNSVLGKECPASLSALLKS